jgi:hypothetical protein
MQPVPVVIEDYADLPDKICLRSDTRRIRMRVFLGGNLSTQTGPFSSAMIYARNYFDLASGEAFPSIEYLNTHAVKNLCWGIREIVEWLLDSDIHFILNHVHQGNITNTFTPQNMKNTI